MHVEERIGERRGILIEDGMCVEQIVVASTTLFLVAGRFGLTPSANRLATPGLKLVDNKSGLMTGDPAGES